MRMLELDVEAPTPLQAINLIEGERKKLPIFDVWTLLHRRVSDTEYRADEVKEEKVDV